MDLYNLGFITKDQVLDACFAIGFDVGVDEMREVTDVDPKMRAEAFLALLSCYEYPIDEVSELVDFFKRTRIQRRPDNFRHLPTFEYFWRRYLGIGIPFGALFLDKFIPKFTSFEALIFKISRNVLGGFVTISVSLGHLNLVLTSSGKSTFSPLTVAFTCVLVSFVAMGSQAWRES